MDRLIWLSVDEIIAIHQAVLRRYGGAAGVRDNGLLEAASRIEETAFAQWLREHV